VEVEPGVDKTVFDPEDSWEPVVIRNALGEMHRREHNTSKLDAWGLPNGSGSIKSEEANQKRNFSTSKMERRF
jgi:hypothetical protein